jgi:hypothetical protein
MNYGISVQRVEIISSPRSHLCLNLETNRISFADTHGIPFPQRTRCNKCPKDRSQNSGSQSRSLPRG